MVRKNWGNKLRWQQVLLHLRIFSAMSTERLSAQAFFVMATSVLQLLIFVSVFSGGVCQNVLLTCPKLPTTGVGHVTCSVNSANFSLYGCLPGKVKFDFQGTSGIHTTLCNTKYSGPWGRKPAGELDCGGVSSTSINTFQLDLPANKTAYDNGNLTCSIDCLPLHPFTTTCTLQYGENTQKSNDGCQTGCRIGLGVGIPLVILCVTVLVVTYVVKKKPKSWS